MEFTTNLYKAYKSMVYGKAIELSTQYGVDKEYLIGEGMLLFTRATNSFNSEKKVAFSTHLHHTLRNLEHRAKKEKRVSINYFTGVNDISEDSDCTNKYNEGFFEQALATIDLNQEKYDLLYDIAKDLSEDAQVYIMDLFKGLHGLETTPKGGQPKKFQIEKIANHYNWNIQQAINVKSEIKQWWKYYKIA